MDQKFSFIALSATVAENFEGPFRLGEGVWAASTNPVELDGEWEDWIGSIKATTLIEDCNLFLCASMSSKTPHVLDEESQNLDREVAALFEALLLTGNVNVQGRPMRIGGGRTGRSTNVRQVGDLVPPLIPAGVDYDEVTYAMLTEAEALARGHLKLAASTEHERIRRILAIYYSALRERNVHERLHQFCRCIEGFILPDPRRTTSQFASRTELFVGPRHHRVTRRLYEMRSSVEHMHPYLFSDEVSERERRLEVMRMAATAQGFARYCVRRFLGRMDLWPHFSNADALASFWQLSFSEREMLWGDKLNLSVLLEAFDSASFSDSSLKLL